MAVPEGTVPIPRKIWRAVVPLACGLGLFVAWSLYYNWRTTGDPFTAPYQIGRRLYNMAPPFLFQKPDLSLRYNFEVMRKFFVEWELETYNFLFTPGGYLRAMAFKAFQFWRAYIRPELTLPLLLVPRILWRPEVRVPAGILAIAIPGLAIETWAPPYYYAPVMGALILGLIVAVRWSESWKYKGRPMGVIIIRAVSCSCLFTLSVVTALTVSGTRITGGAPYRWAARDSRMDARARLEESSRRRRANTSSSYSTRRITTCISNGFGTARISTARRSCGHAR